MPTTADYLADLKAQQTALAANLTAKGVSAAASEKLNTLVPKVLSIQSNDHMACGVFTPSADTATFLKTGLKFKPQRGAVFCADAFAIEPPARSLYMGLITLSLDHQFALSTMVRNSTTLSRFYCGVDSPEFSAVTMEPGKFGLSGLVLVEKNVLFAANTPYFWFACDNT